MNTLNQYQALNKAVKDKILSLTNLPKGWDYGTGIPATSTAVSSAFALLEKLPFDLLRVNAFPQNNGGITFNIWKERENVIEVRVSPDAENSYDFMQEIETDDEVAISNEGENLTLDNLESTIWNLLGLSTPENSTPSLNDLPQIVSQISKTVFQSSTNNALEKPIFVVILTNTTPQLSENLLPIGYYKTPLLKNSTKYQKIFS